jgi:hypothetical protein
MAFVEPVTLEGRHVRIEPLAHEHADAVRAAAADGELWRLWYTSVPAPDKTTEWIDIALDVRHRLGGMPFIVREKPGGVVVGATRYFNVDSANRRLEIGHQLVQLSLARGDRAPRREAGRHSPQPPDPGRRHAARHRRLQHHRVGVARREAPPRVPPRKVADRA